MSFNSQRLINGWLFLLPLFLPLYVIRFKIGPLPTTLLEIFVIATFGVWLIWRIAQRQTLHVSRHTSLRRWVLPIITWLIVTLIAVFIAPDHWAALGYWRAFMLEPVLVFVMLTDLIPPPLHLSGSAPPLSREADKKPPLLRGETKGELLMGIATACILLGAYAILQFFTSWGIPHPWDILPGRRATGIFGFPNGLSLFIAPFGVVCFIEWIKYNPPSFPPLTRGLSAFSNSPLLKGGRGVFLLASALALAAEILAKSLGGIFAFSVGLVLVLLINQKTRRLGLVVTLIGLIASLFVGYKIFSTQLRADKLNESLYLTKRWSGMVRTVIWQESWQIIKAHPLLGTGLRSYQTAVAPFHKATWMEIYPHPHNIFLMLWIETGLMGLLAFIWLCVTWIRVVTREENLRRSTFNVSRVIWLVPLIVILVHGMVDMPYFKNDLAMQFWILAALASL